MHPNNEVITHCVDACNKVDLQPDLSDVIKLYIVDYKGFGANHGFEI